MQVSSPVSVLPPSFEHHHDGLSIQSSRPRISWRFSCSDDTICNWRQVAYDVEITSCLDESGQVFSDRGTNSILTPWPDAESLRSRERRYVRVRSHGCYHNTKQQVRNLSTEWSAWSLVEVALLSREDWKARMMTVQGTWPLAHDQSARPLRFEKTFTPPPSWPKITSARLYITSHGVYEAYINGKKVGNHCLSPGFQSYNKRLHYQTYDVTEHLSQMKENIIQVEVGPGWFASAISWAKKRFIYGEKLGVMAQLEIQTKDSPETWTIFTDESWNASLTEIISSEIYDGELFDRRLLTDGSPSESSHFTTEESGTPVGKLVSPEAAPIRVTQRITPIAIFRSRSDDSSIIDFGRNFAGRIMVRRIHKPYGSVVSFRHAEVMQDGDIMCRPLRTAKAKDTMICDGAEILNWYPKYTFHGFRYVQVTGWSPDDEECPLTKLSIVAEVLHTDMTRTGWFSCSNAEVNKLHSNALWSMKSTFLSVPVECPSRDERFGWTGDLNIFAPTASFLYDTSGILGHWLEDLYLDQVEESPYWRKGVVPLFVPNSLLRKSDGLHAWDPMPNAVWGDAAIMVPWLLYITSGDIQFISRQYQSMVAWLDHGVVRDTDNLWSPDQWQFGDWLDPRAPQNDSGRGTTDGTYIADCFLVMSTRIMADAARLLSMKADSERFAQTALDITESWQRKYLSLAGNVVPDTATALALALSFDLIPNMKEGEQRRQAGSRLARIVRLNDFKITSGFVGTAFIAGALTHSGSADVAYSMLYQKKCPSYLYPITMGATTSWERWDSMLPDGTVNKGSMTSFNHYAPGSIAHWLHTDVGGLEPIESGWKTFRVRPWPNKEMTWVESSYESPYGKIELKWSLKEANFEVSLRVPPNSSAVVTLPEDRTDMSIQQKEYQIDRVVGSGFHVFKCHFSQKGWPPSAILPPWGRAEF